MSDPQQPPVPPAGAGAPAPGQPYGHPSHSPYPPAAQPSTGPWTPAPSGSGSLGRVAFIVALASLAVGLLVTLTFPLLIRALSYDASAIGLIGAVGNGLVLVIAIVALILGILAVRRPGQQILAGIALGIASAEIVGILVAWISNLLYSLSYL